MPDTAQERQYNTITKDQLAEHLARHAKFLSGDTKQGRCLELEGLDLTGHALEGAALEKGIFNKVKLCGKHFRDTSLANCKFNECDLTGATFENVDLSGVQFRIGTILDRATFRTNQLAGARFDGTEMSYTAFRDCTFPITGPETISFIRCRGTKTDFHRADLTNVRFQTVEFFRADFSGAKLFKAVFNENSLLEQANFQRASLIELHVYNSEVLASDFSRADLTNTTFSATDCTGTSFKHAQWRRASLETVTVDGADFAGGLNLHGRHSATFTGIIGAERARYAARLDVCSWAIVRWLGSVPLFGVSYIAIVAIWLWASLAEWYNRQVVALHADFAVSQNIPWIDHLVELPTSRETGLLLLAIMVLATGATIYRFACPKIIQENTDTRWEYDLHREVIEYKIQSNRRTFWRWTSAVCYFLGGGWVILHLGARVLGALRFLLSI